MLNALIDVSLSYGFLTIMTFLPIFIGIKIAKHNKGKNKTLEDIGMCLFGLGLMFGVFWCIYTLYFFIRIIYKNPFTKEKIEKLILEIKERV